MENTIETSNQDNNSALNKDNVIRRFLEDISKSKNIPIERLITGVMQGDLYVWDYDSGRHYQDQFRVVSINGVQQQICEHTNTDGTDAYVFVGNDSHYEYYECTICKKIEKL